MAYRVLVLVSALVLLGCNQNKQNAPISPEVLEAECTKSIKENLIYPDLASFEFFMATDGYDPVQNEYSKAEKKLHAIVTSTNPQDGLESTLDFVCEPQVDGAVVARLLAG